MVAMDSPCLFMGGGDRGGYSPPPTASGYVHQKEYILYIRRIPYIPYIRSRVYTLRVKYATQQQLSTHPCHASWFATIAQFGIKMAAKHLGIGKLTCM